MCHRLCPWTTPNPYAWQLDPSERGAGEQPQSGSEYDRKVAEALERFQIGARATSVEALLLENEEIQREKILAGKKKGFPYKINVEQRGDWVCWAFTTLPGTHHEAKDVAFQV